MKLKQFFTVLTFGLCLFRGAHQPCSYGLVGSTFLEDRTQKNLGNATTLASVGLFAWMVLSVLWSPAPWLVALKNASKYLSLLFFPFLVSALREGKALAFRYYHGACAVLLGVLLLKYLHVLAPDPRFGASGWHRSYIETGLCLILAAWWKYWEASSRAWTWIFLSAVFFYLFS